MGDGGGGRGGEESGLQALTVNSKVEGNQHLSFFNILGFMYIEYLKNDIFLSFLC
jgi:hypothetical protein